MSKNLKAGDKFVIHSCKSNKKVVKLYGEFSIGKIYEVVDNRGELSFKDNDGDTRALELWTEFKLTKIKEDK